LLAFIVFEADELVFDEVGEVGFGFLSKTFGGAITGGGAFGCVNSQ
jgi:hypothetical protein